MAKLSAYGRKELVRLVREKDIKDNNLISWERKTLAFMSDGHILEKRDVRFLPDAYDPQGRLHSWGWKKLAKVKENVSIDKVKEFYLNKGFTII